MYKSPIEKIYGELQTQMVQEDEKLVMKAVREVGVDVDKGELIKALQYDRNQYVKGYEDGKNEVLGKIRAEIKDYFSITCEGNCDNCNRVVKSPCGESVDGTWVLHILDKYKGESEK